MKKLSLNLKKDTSVVISESCEINGLFIGKNNDELKSKITILHADTDIKSRVNIKAVLLGHSRFDLEVVLKIEKGAKNVDTYLKVDCLVIGDLAYAKAVPSLEISENEVKAGHGATIGYIEEEILIYLYSKGLSQSQTEELIVSAFIDGD